MEINQIKGVATTRYCFSSGLECQSRGVKHEIIMTKERAVLAIHVKRLSIKRMKNLFQYPPSSMLRGLSGLLEWAILRTQIFFKATNTAKKILFILPLVLSTFYSISRILAVLPGLISLKLQLPQLPLYFPVMNSKKSLDLAHIGTLNRCLYIYMYTYNILSENSLMWFEHICRWPNDAVVRRNNI